MFSLSQSELEDYYKKGKVNVYQYKTLYQIKYSLNTGFYLLKIKTLPKTDLVGYTLKGRFLASDKNY